MTKDTTYIQDYGGQGTPIVLLHGFLASSRYWKRLQPHLSRIGFRVITIDLLGFGAAPKPKGHHSYTYEEHLEHIHTAIQSLNLDGSFMLAGHSMGAVLSARYATVYPKGVQQAVLLNPPLYMNPKEARETLRNTGRLYRFLLDSRFRQTGWVILKALAKPVIGKHNKHARHGSLRHIIETAELFDDLKHIQVPSLLLVGTEDRPEYLKNIYQSSLGDQVKVVTLPLSHHAPVIAPLVVAETIAQNITALNAAQ